MIVVWVDDLFPSVNVHVASVSAYIPSVEAANGVPSSLFSTDASATLTPKQIQIEVQKQDARERTIVWDAEKISRLDSLDEDAEFEDDPDLPRGPPHNSEIIHDEWTPMGTRSKEGDIVPLSVQSRGQELDESNMDIDASGTTQELLFTGQAEFVPDSVQQLVGLVDSSVIPLG